MSDAAVAETPKVAKRPTRSWSNYWPYLLAALVGLLAKLPTLNNNIIFIDEPTYLMHARRLDSLETFFYSFSYRTEPKFQLGLLPDLLALAISPPNAILIMRLCGLVAVMVSGGLLLSLSQLMFGERVPGWFAWLLWLFFLNRNAADVVPLLEYFQTPLLLFSLWLLIKASGRNTYIFWAGFMVALAGLIKPTALIVAPVLILGLYGLGHPWLKPAKWSFVKRLAGQIAWLGSGISLPLGVFILPYLLRPTALADLKFKLIEISSSYGALGNKSLLTRTLELLAIFENTNLLLIIISGLSYLIIKVFAFNPFRGPQGRKIQQEIGLPPLQAEIRGTARLNRREGWQQADTYQLLLWLKRIKSKNLNN